MKRSEHPLGYRKGSKVIGFNLRKPGMRHLNGLVGTVTSSPSLHIYWVEFPDKERHCLARCNIRPALIRDEERCS